MADLRQFEKLEPTVQVLAHAAHKFVSEHTPELRHMTRWSFPSFVGNSTVFSICGQRSHVNIQISNGAQLDDPLGLMEGTGKNMRHIKIRTLSDLDRPGVAELVRAATDYDLSLPDEGLRARAEKQ